MTFKPEDCELCGNRGTYRIEMVDDLIESLGRLPTLPKTTWRPCSCWYGQREEALWRQSQAPGYINPFLKMTNQEIIKALTKASQDERSIEAEFDT